MIRTPLKLLAVSCLLWIAAPAGAQVGRVSGQVVDPDGKPIPGVTVTVTSPDMPSVEVVKKTNTKGRFLVTHTDVTLRYEYRLEKDGYRTLSKPVRPAAGGTLMIKFVLAPATGPAEEAPPAAGTAAGGAVPARGAIKAYNDGVEAQQAGDLDTAEQKYREALEKDPDLSAAHTSIAAVRFLKGDYASAAEEAEAALEIDPKDTRALQIRYDAYRKLGDEAKTREAAEALKAVGSATEAAKRVFNEGVDAYADGNVAAAMSKFLQAVKLDPDLTAAWIALAQLNLRQGSPERALAQVTKALEQDPQNRKALRLKYDAAAAAGKIDAATAALEQLAATDRRFVVTRGLKTATALYNEGNAAGAVEVLRAVLEAAPDTAKAHYLLGLALFNTGDQAGARQHLERFLELAPNDPDAAAARDLLKYLE